MTRRCDSTRTSTAHDRRIFPLIFCTLLSLNLLPAHLQAATSIELRKSGSAYTGNITVVKDQTVTLELWADVDTNAVAGIAFFVSLPRGAFEIIDQYATIGTQPFNNTGAVFGVFNENRWYVDTVGTAAYDRFDGAVSLGGSNSHSGSGLVASVQLKAVNPVAVSVPVTIDYEFVPNIRDTRFTILNDGSDPFDVRRGVTLNIDLPTSLDEQLNSGVITDYALHANYPNPFNPETTIRYDLPKAGPVTLTVYNLLGQRVATLVDDRETAGSYTARWNGRDYAGRSMPTGMYIYRLEAGAFSDSHRMLLLK